MKTVIVSIPVSMMKNPKPIVSNDASLPVSDNPRIYGINALLEKTLTQEEHLRVILVMKTNKQSQHEKYAQIYKDELNEINENIGAHIEYVDIYSEYTQNGFVHSELLMNLIDAIAPESQILADITYGPKDMPVVIFTALQFAERFLYCDVEKIVYTLAEFSYKKIARSEIFDMGPLFRLSSAQHLLSCNDPERAKAMMKALLTI